MITITLKKTLDLELSQEKTLITNLQEKKARFLGFTIYDIKQRKIQIIKPKDKHEYKRKMNIGLRIGMDTERIYKRMKDNGTLNEKGKPQHNDKMLILAKHEIVTKHNQMIMGLVNYYYENITMKSSVKYIVHLIRKSCEFTLAKKMKKSVRQIKMKHGHNININYEHPYKDKEETVKLFEYKEITDWAEKISANHHIERYLNKAKINKERKEKQLENITNTMIHIEEKKNNLKDIIKGNEPEATNILETKFNLRVGYLLRRNCVICGIENSKANPIEAHHIKHIKKEKTEGFKQIMKQLNRKTIIVCKDCHNKIHKGEYDSIKLSELARMDLALV